MAIYNFLETLKFMDDLKKQNLSSVHLPYVPISMEYEGENVKMVNSTVMYVKIVTEEYNENRNVLDSYKSLLAFMSETARIVKFNPNCRDVSYTQDAIQIIYSTPKKVDVDSVIDDAACIRTLAMVTNKKFSDDKAVKLNTTIGIDYGRLLMNPLPKLNESKSFSLYGKPLENAKEFTTKSSSDNILISEIIWNNIKPENKRLFKQNSVFEDYYEGNIINIIMNSWLISK